MSWFHFHKWKVLSASPMTKTVRGYFSYGVYFPLPESSTQHTTEVLYGCKCGLHKTQSFSGVWTLKDLTGASA